MVARHFMGWQKPALTSTVEYLAARYGTPDELDMRHVVVVLPGSRSGRRLLELLVEEAERSERRLFPPRRLTPGALPEELYQASAPAASELLQRLVWQEVVSQSTPLLEPLGCTLRSVSDFGGRMALARLLLRLHRELAAGALWMRDVPRKARNLEDFHDDSRWEALGVLQQRYSKRLDDLGYSDAHVARLRALTKRRVSFDGDLVLVGTVDLPEITRRMLRLLDASCTALVFAPEREQQAFDDLGCTISSAWRSRNIPIDWNRIRLVERPDDQALAVVDAIARQEERFGAEEITVAVADEALLPFVEERLREQRLPHHRAAGTPLCETLPYRLLDAAAALQEEGRFSALSALLRHPDVERCLARTPAPVSDSRQLGSEAAPRNGVSQIDGRTARAEASPRRSTYEHWLMPLDRYLAEHLQEHISGWREARATTARAEQTVSALNQLLAPFDEPRRLELWAQPISDFLLYFYHDRRCRRDVPRERQLLETFDAIRAALDQLQHLPPESSPEIPGSEALRTLLDLLEGEARPGAAESAAIELLGWLELPFDDAPCTIVTGFNEGVIPRSMDVDPFLPNRLRRELGLLDNETRFARDAYAIRAILESRPSTTLILGRVDGNADPLAPSRLLLMRPRDELPAAIRRLFDQPPIRFVNPEDIADPTSTNEEAQSQGSAPAGLEPSRLATPVNSAQANDPFGIPPPEPPDGCLIGCAVSAFKDYIDCPFGFYLRRVLRLERLTDAHEELDPLAFGNLAHHVLEEFGDAPEAASTDSHRIATFLNAALERRKRALFGDVAKPAVEIQIEQLRQRLHTFADWQAAWSQAGWRIIHTEHTASASSHLLVDGAPFYLRGRIDRVDQNQKTGEVVIIDYKTSAKAKSPESAHRKNDDWIDLQLPLYRHLVADLGLPPNPGLAYFNLPDKREETGLRRADWSAGQLQEADDTAREVARGVRAGRFWPPSSRQPPRELAGIYRADQFGLEAVAVADADADAADRGGEE